MGRLLFRFIMQLHLRVQFCTCLLGVSRPKFEGNLRASSLDKGGRSTRFGGQEACGVRLFRLFYVQ